MSHLMHTPAVRKPQIAKHPFSRLTDGQKHPVLVVLVSEREAAKPLPMLELGIYTPLPEGVWREHVMGDCEYGCKVYVEQSTGQRALAHAGAYGCRKTC